MEVKCFTNADFNKCQQLYTSTRCYFRSTSVPILGW